MQLKKKLTRLDDVTQRLSLQLDPVTSASIADSKATLDHRADSLLARLYQECERLESTMDEQSKFAEKCRIIDTFLKTLSTEESRPSAVDVAVAQQNVAAAKEVLAKIENMQPEMTRLNELGREASLGDEEVRRLAGLNERWEEMCRDKGEEVKRLEQRLVLVEQLTGRFDEFTEFVSRVEMVSSIETDMQPQSAASYEFLLNQQQKIEVAFNNFLNAVNLLVCCAGKNPPRCASCGFSKFLFEFTSLCDIHQIFSVCFGKDLFDRVNCHTVIAFIKEIHIYHRVCCLISIFYYLYSLGITFLMIC